jgi:hypothetical protein
MVTAMIIGFLQAMRGSDEQTGSLFSYVSCEARVRPGAYAAADPGCG